MSLRPEISGFNLDAMYALTGAGDDAPVEQLVGELDSIAKIRDPDLRARVVEVLRRAVAETVRWADLPVEREEHVYAALVLARHGQEHLETGSNTWKMPALWDFIRENFERMPRPGRKYLTTFVGGRGFFARKIETSWSYYGYLALPELQELSAAMKLFRAETSPRAHDPAGDFADEFVGWLELIESSGKDLWFFCC